jgi:hypothetical protein
MCITRVNSNCCTCLLSRDTHKGKRTMKMLYACNTETNVGLCTANTVTTDGQRLPVPIAVHKAAPNCDEVDGIMIHVAMCN